MLSTLFERAVHAAAPLTGVAALFLLLAPEGLAAQQGAVAGEVVDASSLNPLSGAQVVLRDTEHGVLTDRDGRFRITGVPAGNYELRVSMIGYRTGSLPVRIVAGETTRMDVELAVSAVSLEGLVVTATGQQRRREVGNAISTVDASQEVERSRVNTLTNLLQGRSTGVSVRRSSGSLGTASSVKIRGSSSISLDNTPLVYIDGARIDNSNTDPNETRGFFVGGQEVTRLNDINPEDIESIEIVKGPAAATLYGTEAAAGVIRITTKQGRAGGGTRYTGRAEFLTNDNATDLPSIVYPAALGGFGSGNVYSFDVLDSGSGSLASPFRTGTGQSLGGTVRGGTEQLSHFLSAEWTDEEGNLPQNGLQKWSARANFNIEPSDKVSIDVSNGFTSGITRLPNNDNNSAGFITVFYLGSPGLLPILRSDPNGGGPAMETCPVGFETALESGAPLADATAVNCPSAPFRGAFFSGNSFRDIGTLLTEQRIERYVGSATVSYRPLEFWTNRLTVGYDQFADDVQSITPVDPARPFDAASLGAISRDSRTNRNLTLEASSSVSVDLTEELTSSTTVGAQWFKSTEQATQASGLEFPAGSPAINNAVTNTGNDFFTETRTLGVFVQQQLGWRDRLFLTPAVRWDDNSAFGRELDVQAYPRVSATYSFDEGQELPDFVSALKLRAAWGESGKQPPTNAAAALLISAPTSLEGASRLGVFPNRPGNDGLKPERGQEWELGFDLGAFSERLTLEFTYYDQTTQDAIVTRPLSPSLGFQGAQFTNVGEVVNSGFEVGLGGRPIQLEDLSLDLRLNVSTNDNEVTELASPIIFGLGGTTQRHEVGLPFASYKQPTISVDENGDVVISEDPEFQGHPTPEWDGSFSAALTLFRRVSLYGLVDFAGGHQKFDGSTFFSCLFANCPQIFQTGEDGELTDRARIWRTSVAANVRSPFFVDADYAKLRSASLRFELPGDWIDVFGARSASLTVAGENLATFTGYGGIDPEVNFAGGANALHADFFTVPPARRFITSLSVSF